MKSGKKNTSEITSHELEQCDDRQTGKTTGNWLEEIMWGSRKRRHWKRRTGETIKMMENVEYMIYGNGKWLKINFGNMKVVNGNKRGSIVGENKCKNPQEYTME